MLCEFISLPCDCTWHFRHSNLSTMKDGSGIQAWKQRETSKLINSVVKIYYGKCETFINENWMSRIETSRAAKNQALHYIRQWANDTFFQPPQSLSLTFPYRISLIFGILYAPHPGGIPLNILVDFLSHVQREFVTLEIGRPKSFPCLLQFFHSMFSTI